MSSLLNISILEAQDLLRRKKITAMELVDAHIACAFGHTDLNAFVEITSEKAKQQALIAHERICNNNAGIIEGIPIGIKDLFCTKGIKTTAGSRILDTFVPPYESTVTEKLYAQGGVCLGKTNMDEFAMGSSNTHSCYGPVINPWKSKDDATANLVPGGSSGGSAAAVAARLCMGALGSDTGGSIRQPAAFCGIVGVKPTYGRCSRWGMIAFSSSLDQAGVLCRSVADSALVLEAICGYDSKDSTSANIDVPRFVDAVGKSIKGMRIGIPCEYVVDGINADILRLWEEGKIWLCEAGAEVVDVKLAHTSYALPAYYIIAPAEASSNLARYDGVRYGLRITKSKQEAQEMMADTRAAGFGAEVKRRIMIGTYVLSAKAYGEDYVQAQKVRRLIANDFRDVFDKVDAVLAPTTPTPAFSIGERENDPIVMYLNDVFTVPASLAGVPAISVPAGVDSKSGLPLGLQVIGRLYDEETVFKVASVLEKSSGFKGL
ncbi:Glutamyl-tRNA(Gln) amidotransferase subunit A [Alphaproteobacteria bacterium]